MALGSPFNLQKTVTAGIVSNPGRETMGNLTKSPPMIQHDAVINVSDTYGDNIITMIQHNAVINVSNTHGDITMIC